MLLLITEVGDSAAVNKGIISRFSPPVCSTLFRLPLVPRIQSLFADNFRRWDILILNSKKYTFLIPWPLGIQISPSFLFQTYDYITIPLRKKVFSSTPRRLLRLCVMPFLKLDSAAEAKSLRFNFLDVNEVATIDLFSGIHGPGVPKESDSAMRKSRQIRFTLHADFT